MVPSTPIVDEVSRLTADQLTKLAKLRDTDNPLHDAALNVAASLGDRLLAQDVYEAVMQSPGAHEVSYWVAEPAARAIREGVLAATAPDLSDNLRDFLTAPMRDAFA